MLRNSNLNTPQIKHSQLNQATKPSFNEKTICPVDKWQLIAMSFFWMQSNANIWNLFYQTCYHGWRSVAVEGSEMNRGIVDIQSTRASLAWREGERQRAEVDFHFLRHFLLGESRVRIYRGGSGCCNSGRTVHRLCLSIASKTILTHYTHSLNEFNTCFYFYLN